MAVWVAKGGEGWRAFLLSFKSTSLLCGRVERGDGKARGGAHQQHDSVVPKGCPGGSTGNGVQVMLTLEVWDFAHDASCLTGKLMVMPFHQQP